MWTMCPQGENGTAVTDVVTKSVWQNNIVVRSASLFFKFCTKCVHLSDEKYYFMEYQTQWEVGVECLCSTDSISCVCLS